MRTTLDIDPRLLEDVLAVTGAKTKSKAVSLALEDFLSRDRMKQLLAHQGNLHLDLDDWYERRHAGG